MEGQAEEQMVCSNCGTPHHKDCFAENEGCTVFGCSGAPSEEPKLRLSRSDLGHNVGAGMALPRTLGLETVLPAPPISPARVKAPPPPMPPGTSTETARNVPLAPRGMNSILFPPQVSPAPPTPAVQTHWDFESNPDAKARTTFIVLGVLLGPLGGHNFYAGYRAKAIGQLCLTALTLGVASPMTWIWAVIDVCTVDQDSKGIKFKS
jgi:hypothetical protein